MNVLKRIGAVALAAATSCLFVTSALASDPAGGYRISGPHVHENLAVYLVHGVSASGPVPLTLQEAIAKDAVRVIETGNVNQLEIENTSADDIFVQAGDIVKGGKQDRVLTVSLLLTPGSGKVGIGAFCVEQGRWAARGAENVHRFASADQSLPSREAKLAMAKPVANTEATASAAQPRRRTANANEPRQQAAGTSDTSERQRDIWDKVKRTQDKLSGNLGASVAAAQSKSSLQLSLESEQLKLAQKAYLTALHPAAEKDTDVVGLVIAVNGKLSSADVYPSNGLFRKMWAKQLNASATEAIGEKAAMQAETEPAVVTVFPGIDDVKAFLAGAEQGKSSQRTVGNRMTLVTRDAENSLLVEAARPGGSFVHRNYLAK
jgi:hypothetical protein